MRNYSSFFSVHVPRQWFPNCFGPCLTVNSQHYLHTINRHYCQTFSLTPRREWFSVPAMLHALTAPLGTTSHKPAKKQVYMHRPQPEPTLPSPLKEGDLRHKKISVYPKSYMKTGNKWQPSVQMSSVILSLFILKD